MDEHVEIPVSDSGQIPNYEMKIHNYRAYQLVFFCMGVIEVLLALRFIFKLFGANPENMFARIIYWLSGILLFPFNGLFRGTPVADGTLQRFEPSTIIAMVIYALLAWGIAKWILIFKSKPALKE